MKGQAFLMAIFLALIAVILIKVETTSTILPEDSFISENFLNLKEGLIRTVDLSLLNNQSISSNLDSFISLSKEFMKRKNYLEDVTYTISTAGQTTTVNLNISLSLGNSYLKDNFNVVRRVS